MYAQQNDLLTKMKEYFVTAENTINNLKKEISSIKLERDAYKEQLIQLQQNTVVDKNVIYVAIYSHDNGEGMDTEVCIGVFSSKAKAMEAIMDVCDRNSLDSRMFDVSEYHVENPIHSKSSLYVTHQNEEAHCEVSTRILGVHVDPIQSCTKEDVYDVEFVVDEYAAVYPFGF